MADTVRQYRGSNARNRSTIYTFSTTVSSRVAALESAVSSLETELASVTESVTALESEVASVTESVTALETALAAATEAISALETTISECSGCISSDDGNLLVRGSDNGLYVAADDGTM